MCGLSISETVVYITHRKDLKWFIWII